MPWYDPSSWGRKENPVQEYIAIEEGPQHSTALITYTQAYSKLETVNRGTNMIVSAASSLDYDIKDSLPNSIAVGIKQKTLHKMLNFRPNLHQSAHDFRNNIFTDFVLEGNIFIYYDGAFLYHLPAENVEIVPDTKGYVSKYVYQGSKDLKPTEVIHIKDLSSTSIYRGTSRLEAANRSINTLYKMQTYQDQFFDNNAMPGLIFTTENTLSPIAKDKTIRGWMSKYSPKNGAKRPMILDSGLKPVLGLQNTFQEMDFDTSIATHDKKVLKALGVPPILLDGGNNANISPNLRLFYLETVLPIVMKFTSAMERYFGYDIAPVTNEVSALQPEMKDIASYYATLVNGGVLTPNEARVELRYEKDTDPESDKLRVPANIAGSAANPSLGGAPKKPATEPAPKPSKELHGQE